MSAVLIVILGVGNILWIIESKLNKKLISHLKAQIETQKSILADYEKNSYRLIDANHQLFAEIERRDVIISQLAVEKAHKEKQTEEYLKWSIK